MDTPRDADDDSLLDNSLFRDEDSDNHQNNINGTAISRHSLLDSNTELSISSEINGNNTTNYRIQAAEEDPYHDANNAKSLFYQGSSSPLASSVDKDADSNIRQAVRSRMNNTTITTTKNNNHNNNTITNSNIQRLAKKYSHITEHINDNSNKKFTNPHSTNFIVPKNPVITKKKIIKKRSDRPIGSTRQERSSFWDIKAFVRGKFHGSSINDKTHKWDFIPNDYKDLILQVVEGNLQDSITNTFNKYSMELNDLLDGSQYEIDKVFKVKQKLMTEIINKIDEKLSQSQFPTEVSARDIDAEYIFAKRQYIQSRYAEETKAIEKLELEVMKQTERLEKAKEFIDSLRNENTHILKDNLLKGNIHPLLNTAIQNTYGIVGNGDTSESDREEMTRPSALARDIARYNLRVVRTPDVSKQILTDDHREIITTSLPSLRDADRLHIGLSTSIDNFLNTIRREER